MANIDYILKLSEHFCKIAKYFDFEEFNLLSRFDQRENNISPVRLDMLSSFLLIGEGTTRNTYAISSKKALKVAKNQIGISGNKIEFENLKKYDSVWLPKVFARGKDYSWIEVELVRPLNSFSEVNELIRIDGNLFINLLAERGHLSNSFNEAINTTIKTFAKMLGKNLYFTKSYPEKIIKLKSYLDNQYLKELDLLIDETNIEILEFTLLRNLGKSASGNLVLLDIGDLKNDN